MNEQHTVRGVTGTVEQLMGAFGVQVARSTIYMRIMQKGWDFERALLYPGRAGKTPTRLNNPSPIPNPGPQYHWETEKARVEKAFGCSVREIVMVLVSMGLSNDDVKDAIGLRVSSQHFKSLQKKVEEIRAAAAKSQDPQRIRQLQRDWRMRHFDRRKGYSRAATG